MQEQKSSVFSVAVFPEWDGTPPRINNTRPRAVPNRNAGTINQHSELVRIVRDEANKQVTVVISSSRIVPRVRDLCSPCLRASITDIS